MRTVNKIIVICLLFFSFFDLNIQAQEKSGSMTLQECIDIAHGKSPSAKIAKKTYENNIMTYNAFKAGFYPQASITGSLPGLIREINPILQNDGTELFLSRSQLSGNTNLLITQKVPFTGGEISLSSGINRIDALEPAYIRGWSTTPLAIYLRQPLFQYNDINWNMEIQDARAEYYDKQFIESMESISINVTTKFFNLYISEMNVKNAELNVSINDTLYQLSRGRFIIGTIAENDLLHSELELANANNSLREAKLSYLQTLDELKIALGFNESRELKIIPPRELPHFKIDIDKAIVQAQNNSSEILFIRLSQVQAERDLDRAESMNSFNATLTASYGLNKSAGEFNSLYSDLLDQERLNLQFSVPLFQWGKGSSEIEAALASQYKTGYELELNKKNFEIRIKYEILNFERLQQQVAIAARSDTIATRRFEVAKNRYMIGKIDMNALFIAQREKDEAVQKFFKTLRDYWTAYYTIRKLTLYDFKNDEQIFYQVAD
ncbi:TolC family protein [Bacteroidota bacterium]